MDYWQLIRGKKLFVAGLVVAGTVVGGLVTILQRPIYQARATIEILDPRNQALLLDPKDGASGGTTAETYLPTQIRVLESASLQKRVIDHLKANHPWSSSYSDRFAALRIKLGLEPPVVKGAVPPVEMEARVLANSRIIEVTSSSPDPSFAADFANTLAKEYVEYSLETFWQSGQQTSDWLTRKLQDMLVQLQTSESRLQAYAAQVGIIPTGEPGSIEGDKLKTLAEQLSGAQAERMSKQSALEIATASPPDAVPEVIDNEGFRANQEKLAELRQQLAELSAVYTSSYPKVMRVQAQINELEAASKLARENVITRIRNEYSTALRREQLLTTAYEAQSALVSDVARKAVHYDLLKHEVDTSQQLYEEMLRRAKQVGMSLGLPAANVHLLDPAKVPTDPMEPRPARNLLFGLVSGLFIGLGAAVGSEFVNRSLRSPGETAFHLRLPELGVIPSLDAGASRGNGRSAPPLDLINGRNGHRSESVELATWREQDSLFAESFRNVLTSVLNSQRSLSAPRVILITSTLRGEGKSSVVSNMAIALAEINQKVLVLDADMRKPRQHEIFNVPNTWGLSDLLREQTSLEHCPLEALVHHTEIGGLYVLPSGPGTVSIARLLYSKRMRELLERLRSEFDTILVDTPPLASLSDARVVGRLADGAVLVIRAGQTARRAALAAKQCLVADGVVVLGTVLNGWKSNVKKSYYDYYRHAPYA